MVVDEHSTTALCDLGLSKLYQIIGLEEGATGIPETSRSLGHTASSVFAATEAEGTLCYLSPKLLSEDDTVSLASDMYAFTSTCVEVSLVVVHALALVLHAGLDLNGEPPLLQ